VTEDKLKELLDDLGLKRVRQAGTDFLANCPFHKDTDGSQNWAISIEKPSHPWTCYADCSAGTLPMLVARLRNVNMLEAALFLRRYDDGEDWWTDEDLEWQIPAWEETHAQEDEHVIEEEALAAYARKLHPSILRRGFTKKFLLANEVCWDRHSKRVIFPVRNVKGRLAGFVGRAIKDDQKPKYYCFSFPKGKNLYGIHEVKKGKGPLVVVEGPVDRLWLKRCGVPNAVALIGCSCSVQQADLIVATGCRSVVEMLDNDDAGRRGAKRLERMLRGRVELREVTYPAKKDPAELTRERVRKMLKCSHIRGLFV
jgi:DNA primase